MALEVEERERSAAAERDGKAGLYLGTVAGVVVLDIITKWIAQNTLPFQRPVPVIGDFFRLTYIYNPGAAFGLHLGGYSRFIFLVLAVVAVVVLYAMYRTTPPADRLRIFAIAAVSGGAIGNLIDRVRSPLGVVDFFDFGLPGVRWPVFNVADIGVTVGAILLAISLWQEDRQTAAPPSEAEEVARDERG